jgi:hypothetical protein
VSGAIFLGHARRHGAEPFRLSSVTSSFNLRNAAPGIDARVCLIADKGQEEHTTHDAYIELIHEQNEHYMLILP